MITPVPSPLRRDTVRGLLGGLGCEDIAVKSRHKLADVRAMIDTLRREDVLIYIIRQSRLAMKRGRA